MPGRKSQPKRHSARAVAHMSRALELAARGVGLTRPNPPVGAVVVDRRGRVVGEGYHRRAGAAHAEVHALRAAGGRARGGTLYVTLEPCSTAGRTPPCTAAILAAGIRRVVVSVRDPNPLHRGKGVSLLRAHDVAVAVGVCAEQGRALIAPFAKWVTTGRPFVTLKLAGTLDGRIADRTGRSKWITSPVARADVQELRRAADVVMVGVGTAQADDPSLLCRRRPARGAMRLVVDTRGRLRPTAKVFTDGYAHRTIVATSFHCCAATRDRYRAAGATVWELPRRAQRVSLAALMRRLSEAGMLHVLCEGGGTLAGELIRQGRVDRLVLFTAPAFLGDAGHPMVSGASWPLGATPRWRILRAVPCGPDMRLDAEPLTTEAR